MFTIQLASLSILLIQSQVVSLNHFGSRIEHSVYVFMEDLFTKNFPDLFTIATNGQNNSPMRQRFTLHIICINFQVVFLAEIINFRE